MICKSRRNSASCWYLIERRAIGNAAPARITKIPHAITSSISVIPDSLRPLFRIVRSVPMLSLGVRPFSIRLRLNLDGALARHQRNHLVLRIDRIHLHDRELRGSRSLGLNHQSKQGSASTHTGSIWLARGGNNCLPVLGVHSL